MKAILGLIILNINDFAITEAFYDPLITTMGFVIDHKDIAAFAKMKSFKQAAHNLWIRYDQQNKNGQFSRDVGLDQLSFKMKNNEEVDTLYALILKLNAKITRTSMKYLQYTET